MATAAELIKKNISHNITKYREIAGLSQKELANRLHTTPSRVSNWEQGANCPTIDMLFDVCKLLNVSINDIYGVYPETNIVLSYEEKQYIEKYRSLDSFGKETVDSILNRELERQKQFKTVASEIYTIPNSPARFIQYFQKLSAGTGEIINDEMPTEHIVIPDTQEYRRVGYAVKVDGTSMEPRYNDGDMLLIEPTCSIDVGEIGIFNVDGKAYVKKLGETELISLNSEYKNISLTEDSKCMGRVIDKLTA